MKQVVRVARGEEKAYYHFDDPAFEPPEYEGMPPDLPAVLHVNWGDPAELGTQIITVFKLPGCGTCWHSMPQGAHPSA